MQKRILIPTDFSQNSFNALLYAFELFADEECTFYICHAYYIVASKGIPTFPVPDEMQYRAIHDGVIAEMNSFEEKVKAIANNEKHQYHFGPEYGYLTTVLKEKVSKEKIDLVVMKTRGTTDDKDVAYGRSAISVMEKIRECPVLAVPANVENRSQSEIVFPTNFDEKYNWKDMETLKKIAVIANVAIRIVHVGSVSKLNREQTENKKMLEDHFLPLEISFHWLQNVELLEGLLYFVKQRESSMISFVNRKHWFFGTIFSNPLMKNLGIHSTVPLLALHDN